MRNQKRTVRPSAVLVLLLALSLSLVSHATESPRTLITQADYGAKSPSMPICAYSGTSSYNQSGCTWVAGGGSASSAFNDPQFGTKIIRITDSSTFSSGNLSCTNSYQYWPAFNSDSSKLLVTCYDSGGGYSMYVLNFNKTNDTVTSYDRLDQGLTVALESDGAFWSDTSPNILYVIGKHYPIGSPDAFKVLWKLDMTKTGSSRFASSQILHDFSTDSGLSSLGYSWEAGQLGKSADDDTFSFHTETPGTTAAIDVVRWRVGDSASVVYNRGSRSLNESQVTKDGSWVYISANTAPNDYWNMASTTTDITLTYSNAWQVLGHYDLGRFLMAAVDQNEGGIDLESYPTSGGTYTYYNYTLGGTPYPQKSWYNILGFATGSNPSTGGAELLCQGSYPCYAADVSARNYDEKIILGSSYRGLGSIPSWAYQYPFDNEIYFAYSNNPGYDLTSTNVKQEFVRVAHTLSVYTDNGSASSVQSDHYIRQPHAVIDRLARYVVFTSDMGSDPTYGRTDVFVAKLSQAAHPTIGEHDSGSITNKVFHLSYNGKLWIGTISGGSTSWVEDTTATVPFTGGLARASSAQGMDDVYAISDNTGHLYDYRLEWNGTVYSSPSWSDVTTLGYGMPSSCYARGNPAATGVGSEQWVAFRCANGHIMTFNEVLGDFEWSDYGTPTGVTAVSDPTIRTDSSDQTYVYVVGSDGNLWQVNYGMSLTWTNFSKPSGVTLAGAPATTDVAGYVAVTDTAGHTQVLNVSTSTWTDEGTPDCGAVYGDLSMTYQGTTSSYSLYVTGRCASGDKVAVLTRSTSGSWSWMTSISQTQTGWPSIMPVSQPYAGAVSFSSGPVRIGVQTSAGEQMEYDISSGSVTTHDRSYANP
jgi:hypothetical protein